jgi:hypothetical protein
VSGKAHHRGDWDPQRHLDRGVTTSWGESYSAVFEFLLCWYESLLLSLLLLR